MIKISSKINFFLCAVSLCAVLFGSAAAFNGGFLPPKADTVSTAMAQGTFGNINLMTEREFAKLPGIGEKLAERIVEYRTAAGDFESPEQIKKVKGIGEKKYEKIKDLIYTSR